MDAPGSGHNGSVDFENITGRSHSNHLFTKLEVRCFNVQVITLLIQRLLSISLSDNCSKDFGSSTKLSTATSRLF
jgi:hypothetical protein